MVTAADVQQDLPGYLERVRAGESLLIVEADKPLVEMKPVDQGAPPPQRPFGLCRGEFTVPDDFDAPLPDEILAGFEGL